MSDENDEERIESILSQYSQAEQEFLRNVLAKYRAGEAGQWHEKRLREAGIIAGKTQNTLHSSAASLTSFLAAHFAGRSAIDITKQAWNHWKKGVWLPPGAPPPPASVNGVYSSEAAIQWFEKYMLPVHGVTKDGGEHNQNADGDIFQQAAIAEAERKITEAKTAAIELAVKRGDFLAVDIFIRHLRTIGTDFNQSITRHIEKGLYAIFETAIEAWPITEQQRLSLLPIIQESCQQASDAIRAAVAKSLRDASEVEKKEH